MANIGTTLRAARVNRGLSIEQAAQDTRISRKFLEAIEAEDFGALPAPVYVRGFLRSYANYLRVDPAPLLEQVAAALDAPASGPDDFVGGPGSRRGQQAPPPPPSRGPADPWRRRGVAPQVPGYENDADDGYDDGPPQNIHLRESRGDIGGASRPRGVVPNPPGEAREQSARREPLAPLPPPPRPSFPVRSRVEPPPPPPVYPDEDLDDDTEDEYYEDDEQGGVTPYIPPLYDDSEPIRQGAAGRRAPGEMREREYERGGIPPIFLAIAGGIVLLGLFAAAAFFLLGGDDDDGDQPAAGDATNTPTVAISETIAAGTPRPTGTASPAASASASASATRTTTRTVTGTPSVTRTPGATTTPGATSTPDDNTPTATPTSEATATPSPTSEPTATPEPPTATPVPPTATPVPPTATPTVEIVAHPFGYAECAGGNCGVPPLLVICAPDGWFVDVGRNFPNPGWPTFEVLRASDASGVC